jgi:CBS domain-containing protein
MLIGQVCKREVVTVGKSDSVVEVARRMREYHVGDVVIVDGDRRVPLGVITDRDLVVGVVAKAVDRLHAMSAVDIVTDPVVVAREQDDVGDVLRRMEQEGIRRVPVVDGNGGLVGIFTLDDVLDLLATDLRSVVSVVRRQPHREQERRW